MIQILSEDLTPLVEQYKMCGEIRKAMGKDSQQFKQEFEIYKNMMRACGLKYGFNADDVTIWFDGTVVPFGK